MRCTPTVARKNNNTRPKTSEWYGRLVNDSAFRRLSKVVEDGRRYIVHGGDMDAAERYIEPTIMDFGTDRAAFEASEAMQDENFGPIIPIYRYSHIDEPVVQKHTRTIRSCIFTHPLNRLIS